MGMLYVRLALFRRAMSLMKLMTSRLRAESRPLVGSSRKRIFGLVMRRLATPSLFF
jgi:hypothetical protein